MNLKIGTRVIVEGQEKLDDYVVYLEASLERGVYCVRTRCFDVDFIKQDDGKFIHITDSLEKIKLTKANKYENYKIGDRVFDSCEGKGVIQRIDTTPNDEYPITVNFMGIARYYTLCGRSSDSNNTPDLKRLRVKL